MVNRNSHSKFIFIAVLISLLFISSIYSIEKPQLNISFNEYVDQFVEYNSLSDPHSDYNMEWVNVYENQSYYQLSGEIIFENINEEWTNATLIDIWVELDYLDDIIWLNHSSNTRSAIIYGMNEDYSINYSINSTSFLNSSNYDLSNAIVNIPELRPGENVTINYRIDPYNVRPPLNFTTYFNNIKVLAGDSLEITDYVQNVFENNTDQITCIRDIHINQEALKMEFGDNVFNFSFINNVSDPIWGDDYLNAEISDDNYTLNWSVIDGDCLDLGETTNISYGFLTPDTILATGDYDIINTTLSYNLDSTISHLGVRDVLARTEGVDIDLSKSIYEIAKEDVTGDSNVTWEVRSNISTYLSNITYNITEFTLWVSERNSGGSEPTNPNNIDVDSISGDLLNVSYDWQGMHYSFGESDLNCGIETIFSTESPFTNEDCEWYFNYSDLPTPIVWTNFKFEMISNDYNLYNGIGNDNIAQIQTHPTTENNVDNFVKQLYLIVDYWLELEKNITSLGNDTYKVEIWVHNKGNQYTPIGMPVTIFDFIPESFEVITDFKDYDNESIYSDTYSDMYATNHFNTSINNPDGMSGELMRWQLNYDNPVNASLAPGHDTGWDDFDSTWYVQFEVRGEGEYNIDELYIVGLDPDLVDGAISNFLIELKGGFYSLKNEELSFVVAFLFSLSIMFLVIFKI